MFNIFSILILFVIVINGCFSCFGSSISSHNTTYHTTYQSSWRCTNTSEPNSDCCTNSSSSFCTCPSSSHTSYSTSCCSLRILTKLPTILLDSIVNFNTSCYNLNANTYTTSIFSNRFMPTSCL